MKIHGSVHKLAQGVVGSPRISGDGHTVVWNQLVGDNLEIMRWHDGQVDQLTRNGLPDMHAVPNEDGSVIVWERCTSNEDNDPNARWQVVRWENGQETVLTDSVTNSMDPTVSADGKTTAWSNDVDGRGLHWKVQQSRAGVTEDVTSEQGNNSSPVLDADGSHLFWREFHPEGGSDVWLHDSAGNRPLTQSPEAEVRPACTADGKTLYYSVTSPAGDDDLFRFDVASGAATPFHAEKNVDETWPALSADGKTVAWTNFDRRWPQVPTHVMLQGDGQTAKLSHGSRLHTFPSVSDDGRSVVWMGVDRHFHDRNTIELWQRS